jgi:ribonuclease BN (tRNA processing enzyme)
MKVRVLGCSGGIGKDLRTTSFLINDEILLDAGTGVGELTLNEMLSIRHVVITHAHLDHVCGLALMLASIYDDMPPPITLYAPPPVLMVLKISLYNWQLWPDFTELPEEDSPILQMQALEEGTSTTIDELYQFEPVMLGHTVESYAYIITTDNSSLCFFGDTGPTEKVWQRLNELDDIKHILVEASFPNDNDVLAMQSGHYTAALLAEDLKQLNHKPVIHIHHIKPGCEKTVIKQCHEALTDYKVNIVDRTQILDFT